MLIYLAGCMSYYYDSNNPEKAEIWRNIAEEKLQYNYDVFTFNPTLNYETNCKYNSVLMVQQNEYYLKKADLILVNLDDLDKSYGTIYELVYAHALCKPILAFGSAAIYSHPHLKHILKNCFKSLEEALEFIDTVYCQ